MTDDLRIGTLQRDLPSPSRGRWPDAGAQPRRGGPDGGRDACTRSPGGAPPTPAPPRKGEGKRRASSAAWEREAPPLTTVRMRSRADALRCRLTEPERRLWWHLRHSLGVADAHFRRQVAIGSYVVDFCSLAYRIVVEVDGNQHGTDEGRRRDASREAVLSSSGFRTVRFTNREVMIETRSVLDTILAALDRSPSTPSPSPQGGGERVQQVGAES